jgi:hypothetical protein
MKKFKKIFYREEGCKLLEIRSLLAAAIRDARDKRDIRDEK